MANLAIKAKNMRSVTVNRLDLIKTLKSNLEKHKAEYNEAMASYKERFKEELDKAFQSMKKQVVKDYKNMLKDLDKDDIQSRRDTYFFTNRSVTLPIPRSYESQYLDAISIAEWDVRDTLELQHAEFVCFVKDEWDWKEEFTTVAAMYKKA